MEEYDNIPVLYCKNCLSLRIMSIDDGISGIDFCDECGKTEIGETDIHAWEKMYRERYNKDFLTGKDLNINSLNNK